MNTPRRYQIEQARKALADAKTLDLGDDRAMARMLGRLEVTVSDLLEAVDDRDGEEAR